MLEQSDELYNYLIAAASISTLILAPNPVSAISAFCTIAGMGSLKISSLLSWLPDKFKFDKEGRESSAIRKYESIAVTHFFIMNLALRNSFETIVAPMLIDNANDFDLSEKQRLLLTKLSTEADTKLKHVQLQVTSVVSPTELKEYALIILGPLINTIEQLQSEKGTPKLKKIALSTLQQEFIRTATINYNSYLLNLTNEFSEFGRWVDMGMKQEILSHVKKSIALITGTQAKSETRFKVLLEEAIHKIELVRAQTFIEASGFPSFIEAYQTMFKEKADHFYEKLNAKTRDEIQAHHKQILAEIERDLVENNDIEEIIYPSVKDIYISQSFDHFEYSKKNHGRNFLTSDFWQLHASKGENIANHLLELLNDPMYCRLPIVILGNPGAGKSMLSKMLAGQLIQTNELIPFLIKLRNVASGTANIAEHISKGLSRSIESGTEINWLDWAKEFKDRKPVIILDGFDELMSFTQSELNNYLNLIKEFQEVALSHDISARVILTSRLTVMQEVHIPEKTRIIKLNGFDKQRKELWTSIWNSHQKKKGYKFALPLNENVQHLSEEPLLLFMLAVYDFQNSGLQKMVNENTFSQSQLYDSLLSDFAKRQLEKNEHFKNANQEKKNQDLEDFRLRLGVIALLMFLNNTTNRDTVNIEQDLKAFELGSLQKENILGGFFFIHENKATSEGDIEKLNYEFLHKTFGEFLAADFLLRVAAKQEKGRGRNLLYNDETFKFCFGFNWLHKHENILNFLMEHATTIIKTNDAAGKYVLNNIIKKDLQEIFNRGVKNFPVTGFILLKHNEVIDHLAIYSQNLIYLWLAISGSQHKFKFDIFDLNDVKTSVAESATDRSENIRDLTYKAQDRDEINLNKMLWKRLCGLWVLTGNKYAVAKLQEQLSIEEAYNSLTIIKKHGKIQHNFCDAAMVGINDFEIVLSLFDRENSFFHKNFDPFTFGSMIVERKPELHSLLIDALLYRIHEQSEFIVESVIDWFTQRHLNYRQATSLIKYVIDHKYQIPSERRYRIFNDYKNEENLHIIIKDLADDIDSSHYSSHSGIIVELRNQIWDFKSVEFLEDINTHPESILYMLKIDHFSRPTRHHERLFSDGYLEEVVYKLSREINHRIQNQDLSVLIFLKSLNLLLDKREIDIKYLFTNKMLEPLHSIFDRPYDKLGGIELEYEYLILIEHLVNESKILHEYANKIKDMLINIGENFNFFLGETNKVFLKYLIIHTSFKQKTNIPLEIPESYIMDYLYRFDMYHTTPEHLHLQDFLDEAKILLEISRSDNQALQLVSDRLERLYDYFSNRRFNIHEYVEFLKIINQFNIPLFRRVIGHIKYGIIEKLSDKIATQKTMWTNTFIQLLDNILFGFRLEHDDHIKYLFDQLFQAKQSTKIVTLIMLIMVKHDMPEDVMAPFIKRSPKLKELTRSKELASTLINLLNQEP